MTNHISTEDLAGIYERAAVKLFHSGYHKSAEGLHEKYAGQELDTMEVTPAADGRHSMDSAIRAAAREADKEHGGTWSWPEEEALRRFAGYLYLTGELTANPGHTHITDMVTYWELQLNRTLDATTAIDQLSTAAHMLWPEMEWMTP